MTGNEAIKLINNYDLFKRWLEQSGSELLKKAIKESNASLREFAKWSNYSPTYICKVRKGDMKMSIPMFHELWLKGYIKADETLEGLFIKELDK